MKTCQTRSDAIRPLSKQEIDRRIEGLGVEVVGLKPIDEHVAGDLRPRWIEASELVRRLAPFISRN